MLLMKIIKTDYQTHFKKLLKDLNISQVELIKLNRRDFQKNLYTNSKEDHCIGSVRECENGIYSPIIETEMLTRKKEKEWKSWKFLVHLKSVRKQIC